MRRSGVGYAKWSYLVSVHKNWARTSHSPYRRRAVLKVTRCRGLERWRIDDIAAAPAAQILLVDRDDRPADLKLGAHLEAVGACVTRIRPKGTAEMLELPQFAKVPELLLEEILTWLAA